MHFLLKRWVAENLRSLNRRWNRSLELGCGRGDGGALLRPYTRYLLGVDIDPNAVGVAQKRGVYDEAYVGDARKWPLEGFDSVFMFEVIEHVSKEDGEKLLTQIGTRFVMLTTPWRSLTLAIPWRWDGHQCVWSEEELRRKGFKTAGYSFMPIVHMYLTYGGITIGVR